MNDSFLDPLEQRVSSPSLTPAQQRQLSLNAKSNVFGTLPPPAGHFENPDDASTSSDSFHSVVQNAGGAQQADEGTHCGALSPSAIPRGGGADRTY